MTSVPIPFPISNNPGLKPQEGTGRLVNCFVEARGDNTPVWRRAPGASVFARAPSSGSASMEFLASAAGQYVMGIYTLVGNARYLPTLDSTNQYAFASGTVSGDFVCLMRAADERATTWDLPTGFTNLVSQTSLQPPCQVAYKLCTGDQSATVIANTGSVEAVALFTIRGQHTVTPIDAVAAAVSTGATGDPNPPSVTTASAGTLVVAFGAQDDDVLTSIVPPSSYMDVGVFALTTAASGASASCMIGFYVSTVAGAENPGAFSTDGDDEWVGFTFAIKAP